MLMHKGGVVWVLAVLGVGAGCASKRQAAVIGGTTGAVLGAGAGAVTGGKKGAVIGGAVGAAAGATGGYLIKRYMDKQQKELEREVKGATVERRGDQLYVKFDDAILFDVNESTIKPQARGDLEELARVLKEYKDTVLVIEGHTDSTGPRDWNEELSLARATAVVDFLTDRDVAIQRMTARGFADSRPVASNATTDGRRQNRRVQVRIAANEELQRRDAAYTRQQQRNQQPQRAQAPR